jgi:hypothetical protein
VAYQPGVIVFGLARQFGSGPGDAGAWATGQQRLRQHDHALAELGCQGGFAGTCRGFQAYWHRRSRRLGGRPKIDRKIRDLIRRMNRESSPWGAPRIQDELLMLGHLSGAMAPRVELQLRKRALDDMNPYPRLFAPRSHRTVDFQSRIHKGGKKAQAVASNERKKETTIRLSEGRSRDRPVVRSDPTRACYLANCW